MTCCVLAPVDVLRALVIPASIPQLAPPGQKRQNPKELGV
jgi:hypothetical protein